MAVVLRVWGQSRPASPSQARSSTAPIKKSRSCRTFLRGPFEPAMLPSAAAPAAPAGCAGGAYSATLVVTVAPNSTKATGSNVGAVVSVVALVVGG